MKGILLKIIILPMFVFFGLPLFTQAQSLSMSYSPLYPSSGDNVSVSISSFEIDLAQSEISWYKDEKLEKKGIGMKNFSFQIGEDGSTIRAAVKTGNSTLHTSLRVNTSSMDVLWEVVGAYEPPFYKGKVSPIKGSQIKVVAIPQIKSEKGLVSGAGSFVYAWKKDGSNIAGQSGFGANSFTYSPQVLDRENRIEVSAGGMSRSLEKSLVITPSSSEIHFYEYSFPYGPLYNKALKDGQTLNNQKISVLAEPYFIFTQNINDPSLDMEWKVNNSKIQPTSPNLILLSAEKGETKAAISVKVINKIQLLQDISRNLKLNFSINE